MGTTNYVNTFIQVAQDCPAVAAQLPASRGTSPTVAELQHELIFEHPYEFTSDDVLFEVHAIRHSIPQAERTEAREAFFAKSQACLRSSPLAKRYGWGIHHNTESKIALIPLGSEEYEALAADETVEQTRAMRSRRA